MSVVHVSRREALKLGLTGLLSGGALSASARTLHAAAPNAGHPGDSPGVAYPVGTASRRVPSPAAPETTFRLAFGSCNRSDLPQPLWSDIRATAPDVWAWLGDNVYADSDDVSHTRRLYAEQAARMEYQKLVAQTQVVGIWDDHDFGRNDAGFEYPSKLASQAALLDFLGEPLDSPRRRRFGVYTSYTFGRGERSVKLILLDARFHRDPPAARGDTLGDEQWTWLERELRDSTARVNLIASGYQVLPYDHPGETWAKFPSAQRRLLDLVATSRARGVVFLSGDRHRAELSCFDHPALSRPLYELTSSGLTHAYDVTEEPNALRVGRPFPKLNFGVVSIDWERDELTLEARGQGSVIGVGRTLRLAALG